MGTLKIILKKDTVKKAKEATANKTTRTLIGYIQKNRVSASSENGQCSPFTNPSKPSLRWREATLKLNLQMIMGKSTSFSNNTSF